MAVIALSGNTMSCALGMGSFESIGNAFTSAKNSAGGLSGALKSLSSKIDMASIATNVSSSQEQASQAHGRETEKQSTLSLAYGKLESLISNVGVVDDRASSKIHQRKNDFYNRYNYLKPDCEKSDKELKAERRAEKWENFKNWCSGVVESAKNFVKNVAEWCKEHWVAIVTALAVIVIAVVAAVFLGPAAVIAICSAIAFFCAAGDLVATLVTGKDIYTLLKESGHPILAEMFAGLEWGATIAAVALSFVQLGSQIAKVGLKTFLTGGEQGIGNIMKFHFKNLVNGLKADFKSVFGSGLKMGDRLKAVWNIVVLNQSGDFNFKQSILDYRSGEKVIRAVTDVGFDDNNNLVIKSDRAADILGGDVGDSISTKKSSFLFDNTVDYNWTEYGAEKISEVDIMKMYADGKIPYKPDGSINNQQLRKAIWDEAGIPKNGLGGNQTAHELYEIRNGKVSIYSVDKSIHTSTKGNPAIFLHNGGVSHAAELIQSIRTNNFAINEIMTVFRQTFNIPPLWQSVKSTF